MTQREFLTAILALTATQTGSIENAPLNITMEDVASYATAALAKLDENVEKRKVSPSALKARAEQEEFRAKVFATLTDEPQTAAMIAEILDTTTAKVAGALRKIDGIATVDFKPEGAKRKTTGYLLAADAPAAQDEAEEG